MKKVIFILASIFLVLIFLSTLINIKIPNDKVELSWVQFWIIHLIPLIICFLTAIITLPYKSMNKSKVSLIAALIIFIAYFYAGMGSIVFSRFLAPPISKKQIITEALVSFNDFFDKNEIAIIKEHWTNDTIPIGFPIFFRDSLKSDGLIFVPKANFEKNKDSFIYLKIDNLYKGYKMQFVALSNSDKDEDLLEKTIYVEFRRLEWRLRKGN